MSNKYRLFFLIVLLLHMKLYSQKGFFTYGSITIDEAGRTEKQYNSKQYFPKHKLYVSDKVYQLERPWFFERPQSADFRPVDVKYYFSKNDSIVRRVSYNWSVKDKISKSRFFNYYGTEFDKIVAHISNDIGAPGPNQGQIVAVDDEVGFEGRTDKHYERTVVWENEIRKVTTTLLWSEEHGTVFQTTVFLK